MQEMMTYLSHYSTERLSNTEYYRPKLMTMKLILKTY